MKGRYSTLFNGLIEPWKPSVLAIVITGATVGAYCVLGMVFNFFFRKKRGIQTIPHVNFLIDLPFLMIDGIKCIILCGRIPPVAKKRRRRKIKKAKYNQLEEDLELNAPSQQLPGDSAGTGFGNDDDNDLIAVSPDNLSEEDS